MRPFRLGRWGSPILPLGTRPPCPYCCRAVAGYSLQWRPASSATTSKSADGATIKRPRGRPRKSPLPVQHLQSNAAAAAATAPAPAPKPETALDSEPPATMPPHEDPAPEGSAPVEEVAEEPISVPHEELPSPPPEAARTSAKLSALHARLSLPKKFPIETLARTLVDRTADPDLLFNNTDLSNLGADLLNNHISEHLICNYPRLPMILLEAAHTAFVGDRTLAALASEWGVDVAAEPGGEVDPGLLQFRRAPPGWIPVNHRTGMRGSKEEYQDQPPVDAPAA